MEATNAFTAATSSSPLTKRIAEPFKAAAAQTKDAVQGGTRKMAEKLNKLQPRSKNKSKNNNKHHKSNEDVVVKDDSLSLQETNPAVDKENTSSFLLEEETGPPPPDEQLKSMEMLLDKKLGGLRSIKDYHNKFWKDARFFTSWLEASGKMDIQVGEWQRITPCVNPWDGETYDCQRVVKFRFQRTTHLYTGKPIANVVQTHYCRVEGTNRCIVAMKIETFGVPFSDSFSVQLRWVATRAWPPPPPPPLPSQPQQQQQELHIQVGIFVVFTKQVIVANKIRSGVREETTQTQVDLFRTMKQKCMGGEAVEKEDKLMPSLDSKKRRRQSIDLLATKVNAPIHSLSSALVMCFPFWVHNVDDDHEAGREEKNDVEDELEKVQQMIRTVRALPLSSTPARDTQRDYVLSECRIVQEAFDSILVRELRLEESHTVAKRNATAQRSTNRSGNDRSPHLPTALQPVSDLFGKVTDQVRAITPRNWFKDDDDEDDEPMIDSFDADQDPEPDKVLRGMNVIVSKTMDGTVQDIYKLLVVDDENKNKSKSSFYRSWLEATDRKDVEISPWSVAPPGELFVEEWSKETFERRRTVTARVSKSKFMKQAVPSAVMAKQSMEQYCRLEGNDRLVMAASTKVDHFAFSNAFQVCIRWVVSRVGKSKVSVKVGMFVLFQKHTLLESKIRAGALKESQKLQLDFFRRIRDTIQGGGNVSGDGTIPPAINNNNNDARRFSFDESSALARALGKSGIVLGASTSTAVGGRGGSRAAASGGGGSLSSMLCSPLEQFLVPKVQKMSQLYPSDMLEDDDVLRAEFHQMQLKLQTIKTWVVTNKKSIRSEKEYDDNDDDDDENERLNFIQGELGVAYEALDNVVVWHGNKDNGPQILADASFSPTEQVKEG